MFQWDILCASTKNVQKKRVACIIRPGCCYQKIVFMEPPSIPQPGRMASASISERKDSYRKHGALRIYTTMSHIGISLRRASVFARSLVVAMALTTDIITARTSYRQNSRQRSCRLLPSTAAPTASASTTTSRRGTSGNCRRAASIAIVQPASLA